MKSRLDDIQTPLLILALAVQTLLLLRLDWTTSPNRTELGHIAAALQDGELKEIAIDVTEHPINRPKEGQKEWYSGKKNGTPTSLKSL